MEIWKDIAGFECEYQASSIGRIKSLSRIVVQKHRLYKKKEKILKPHKGKVGYHTVAFHGKTLFVHHIIATTFIGIRPKGLHIDHINGCYLDNRSCNLRYVTQKENVANAIRLNKLKMGENAPWSKLKSRDVSIIKSSTETSRSLAIKYGVSRQNIDDIKNNKTWKHIK